MAQQLPDYTVSSVRNPLSTFKLKNAVFWGVAPCRFCVNRCFRGTYCLHLQVRKIRERATNVRSLQPPAHACSSLADFSTLKMEMIRPSEMSVHTRSTRRHIPEDGILHSHRRENLKSYITFKFMNVMFLFSFSVIASCCVNYINLFIETVTTQRFNEITCKFK
jgi:hypothetical protein